MSNQTRQWVVVFVMACTATFAGCAPVIMTGRHDIQLFAPVEKRSEIVEVALVTSRLEKTEDTIDIAKLKKALEKEFVATGLFTGSRVQITGGDAPHLSGSIEVRLTRLEYTKTALRLPPAPPLGLAVLLPVVAPLMLTRDYIKLQVTVEADLLLYDAEGRLAKEIFMSESAIAQANFFNMGEGRAAEKLESIALHNFCRQLLQEFLFLTR